jgi:phage terminase large subunit GpA-like protein
MSNLADGHAAILEAMAAGVRPDPDMWVDEWAEEHMMIPKGAEPGKYRGDRTPYAAAVMRCLSPAHPCKRVVVRAASQMLKTQTALNWIGASIHQAPANILVLLPTLPLAKRVSSRIADVINAVPVLQERVASPRSRDARNTIDTKEFTGGALHITTAGSASNLAEIPCRYIYGDEIDRWEGNVGGEGDPVTLAEARTSTYSLNKKLYYTSSPTIKGASRIDALYEQGDQQHLYLPCPHCGHRFVLQWEHVRHDEGLKRAWLVCPECAAEIDENAKPHMLAQGEWRAHAEGDGETVSFDISALYMPIGWVSWLELCKEHRKAEAAKQHGDHGPAQVFSNTRLARSYDATESATPWQHLKQRAEPYPLRVVPRAALALTAAVDTQPNRLELMIVGWGPGLERWVVDYHVLWGSPSEDAVWQELDTILATPVQHAAGRYLGVEAAFIDSGGANTQDVYEYTRHRKHRRIFAIKGASKPNRPIVSGKPSKVDVNWRGRTERQGAELWFIGTDVAKDWIYSRYKLANGPGALHFSVDLEDDFYKGATAESKITKFRRGFPYSEWVKPNGARNEPLDLLVYNLAVAHYLGLNKKRDADWDRMRQKVDPLTGDLFTAAPPAGEAHQHSTNAATVTSPPIALPTVVRHTAPTLVTPRGQYAQADDPHLT